MVHISDSAPLAAQSGKCSIARGRHPAPFVMTVAGIAGSNCGGVCIQSGSLPEAERLVWNNRTASGAPHRNRRRVRVWPRGSGRSWCDWETSRRLPPLRRPPATPTAARAAWSERRVCGWRFCGTRTLPGRTRDGRDGSTGHRGRARRSASDEAGVAVRRTARLRSL